MKCDKCNEEITTFGYRLVSDSPWGGITICEQCVTRKLQPYILATVKRFEADKSINPDYK